KYFSYLVLQAITESGTIPDELHFVDSDYIYAYRRNPRHKLDWVFLQTLLGHSLCGERQCQILADNGLFLILHAMRDKYKNDLKVQHCIAQILANVSVH